ncbi:histidine phosphatase family protein [Streptomyces sp. NPDC020965]|uniref:histidine phosphatase family protein n=1 Tax=Streptomyces sp. NPDC020965 TaxID=3365105 RepID=UPI0037A5AC50
MTVRLTLVSPATTSALREARFGGDEGLDGPGLRAAGAAAGALPRPDRALTGPSRRCRETATALGLRPERVPAPADCAMGTWHGRTLDEVSAAEPAAVSRWLSDPSAAPHGGESLRELCGRVGAWLDSLDPGHVVAVVEPGVVRATTVRALDLPLETFWRLDVAPLTLTRLSGRLNRWNLRCGSAPGGG